MDEKPTPADADPRALERERLDREFEEMGRDQAYQQLMLDIDRELRGSPEELVTVPDHPATEVAAT